MLSKLQFVLDLDSCSYYCILESWPWANE